MADFNPPDHHWAADFDARLIASFQHLKDAVDSLREEVAALKATAVEQDRKIDPGIADARAYWKGGQ